MVHAGATGNVGRGAGPHHTGRPSCLFAKPSLLYTVVQADHHECVYGLPDRWGGCHAYTVIGIVSSALGLMVVTAARITAGTAAGADYRLEKRKGLPHARCTIFSRVT